MMNARRNAELRNEGFSCQVLTEWIPKTHQEHLCRKGSKSGYGGGETGAAERRQNRGGRHVRRGFFPHHHVNDALLNTRYRRNRTTCLTSNTQFGRYHTLYTRPSRLQDGS